MVNLGLMVLLSAHSKLALALLFLSGIYDKGQCLRSGHPDIPLPSQPVGLLNWELMQWNY